VSVREGFLPRDTRHLLTDSGREVELIERRSSLVGTCAVIDNSAGEISGAPPATTDILVEDSDAATAVQTATGFFAE
jgi:hypothetical protein